MKKNTKKSKKCSLEKMLGSLKPTDVGLILATMENKRSIRRLGLAIWAIVGFLVVTTVSALTLI